MTSDTWSATVKTYRYVRLAMVALVVALGVAIAVERGKAPGCFQHSISAYYYTPVRGMFVGGLLGIGVCLVALRGNSDLEDALLNLAGGLAPVVAFVPTPNAGSCTSTPGAARDPGPDVSNNITSLLVLLALALALAAVLLRKEGGAGPTEWLLLGAGALLWGGALLVFDLARDTFLHKAHYTAAIAMFACIVAVVWLNALGFHDKQEAQGKSPGHPATNRYAVIAGLMVVSAGGIGVWDWTVGWDHAVLAIESCLITLFGTFWVLQTQELWEGGVRSS